MSTQNENLFVKLVRKSVGLPTGKSDCCGSEKPQDLSAGCGCGSQKSAQAVEGSCGCDDPASGCCGNENEKAGGCCG